MTRSLEAGELLAASVAKTPARVTLDHIHRQVASIEYLNPANAPTLTIAVVLLNNGFVVTGESKPSDPNNFDAHVGRTFALDRAMAKVWEFEGYMLCELLKPRGAPGGAAPLRAVQPEGAA